MEFKKIFRDTLEHCYAVMHLKNKEHDFLVVASEENQPCYAYDLDHHFARREVWPQIGGTMTMVQIPGTLDFLATQMFYPGFQAAKCRLVCEKFNGNTWEESIVAEVPYVHRFDLIPAEDGGYWYIGCSVARSKKFTEDWSDPGQIFVGRYCHQQSVLEDVHTLPKTLTKNHGYYRPAGKEYAFITAADGIYRLYFPKEGKDWCLEQINERETSDIVPCDINGDGKDEYMAIEGFHGDRLRFYDEKFTLMNAEGLKATPFGHALWGGRVYGKACFIFGYRGGDRKLFCITQESGKFCFQEIDQQAGTSNVLVYEKGKEFFLLAANRESSEVAVYKAEAGKDEAR